MNGDFSAVYVRLMQGELVAQLSRDINGEAAPARSSDTGGVPGPSQGGLGAASIGARPEERGAVSEARSTQTGLPGQPAAGSMVSVSGASASRPPSASISSVVPDQLEPQMRAAADERLATVPSDTVQRLRLAPAASLTLAGLPRPSGSSGDAGGSLYPSLSGTVHGDPSRGGETGFRPTPQPAGGDTASSTAGRPGMADLLPGSRPGVATDGGIAAGGLRPGLVDVVTKQLPASAATAIGQQPHVASMEGAGAPAGAPRGEAMQVSAGDRALHDAMSHPARQADGLAMRTAGGDSVTSRAPTSPTGVESAAFSSAGSELGGADRPVITGTASISTAPLPASEAFLAAFAAIGNRADQAVSRDMLSAVILNAAMIPGWPFPKAIENSALATEARRAAGQLAAAGAEELKLTPEEMIAYLTSIGANARLLKALQDLFVRLEKKEAVQLMAWLHALTSALREIEKSVEDLLRKGTLLPEWAEDMADQIRKSLSKRHRYQI